MLSDFLRLQKVLLNHSGISSLNSASLFSYCLAYASSFAGVKTEVCHPFISPDSIALADREGKKGRRAVSFTILACYLYSFDFMKLETRLTTQLGS